MRKFAGPVALLLVAVAMFFGIKLRYGSYNHYYYLRVDVPRAGQLLRVGTDVRERGVVIGKVSDIQLANPADNRPHAELTLQIEPTYRIPQDTRAFVSLKTLLGDKYVDLRSPAYSGPWLRGGARIQGLVGPEIEDVLQSGVHIFDAIPPSDLATVVGNLAQAARGHGVDVARSFQSNARLSTIFASTLPPQLRALRDFDVIFLALKAKAVDLNRLADMVNQGAPVYASPRAHRLLDQALKAVTPFAQNLADLLIFQKPEWDRMIDSGDPVLQTVSLHAQGLHDLIHGLYVYVHKLGGKPPYLSDGSGMAPFSNFSESPGFPKQIQQLCNNLPAPVRKQIPICKQSRYSH